METGMGTATEAEVEAETMETATIEMTDMDTPALSHCQKVVELVQVAFWEGQMAEDSIWQAVVLIPKGGGDYRCINLVELVWKVVTVIPNHRFTNYISFHDVLHGFWAGRGTGTAPLEVKML